eukprot:641795-Pleurochrysis_carterae.AAC.1
MDAKDMYDEAADEVDQLKANLNIANAQAKELQAAVAKANKQVEATVQAAASAREAHSKEQ